ncbi:MAG: GNAT family N-acetyltransferase [Candidatus Caldarchaeum sp.]|nr:GNAT family N-acetyltransferase [Candidatus Caldarchaeum sp.]
MRRTGDWMKQAKANLKAARDLLRTDNFGLSCLPKSPRNHSRPSSIISAIRKQAMTPRARERGEQVRNVGVGRLIIDPDRRRAEFAVLVADDFQGQGLGTKLVDMIIEVAQDKKVSTIYGIILPENIRMINLARKMGFTVKRRAEDVYVELRLDTEKPVETKPKPQQITITTKEG